MFSFRGFFIHPPQHGAGVGVVFLVFFRVFVLLFQKRFDPALDHVAIQILVLSVFMQIQTGAFVFVKIEHLCHSYLLSADYHSKVNSAMGSKSGKVFCLYSSSRARTLTALFSLARSMKDWICASVKRSNH